MQQVGKIKKKKYKSLISSLIFMHHKKYFKNYLQHNPVLAIKRKKNILLKILQCHLY